jgi:hypothetical protein
MGHKKRSIVIMDLFDFMGLYSTAILVNDRLVPVVGVPIRPFALLPAPQ